MCKSCGIKLQCLTLWYFTQSWITRNHYTTALLWDIVVVLHSDEFKLYSGQQIKWELQQLLTMCIHFLNQEPPPPSAADIEGLRIRLPDCHVSPSIRWGVHFRWDGWGKAWTRQQYLSYINHPPAKFQQLTHTPQHPCLATCLHRHKIRMLLCAIVLVLNTI